MTGNPQDCSIYRFAVLLAKSLSSYWTEICLPVTSLLLCPRCLLENWRQSQIPQLFLIQCSHLTFQEPNPVFQWGLIHTVFTASFWLDLHCKITLTSPSPQLFCINIFNFWFWSTFILTEKVQVSTNNCPTPFTQLPYLTFYHIALSFSLCVCFFLNHLRLICRHFAPLPLNISVCTVFTKNRDTLLHDHSTTIKVRK